MGGEYITIRSGPLGVALNLPGEDVPLSSAGAGGQANLESGSGGGCPPEMNVHVVTIRLATN